MKKIDIQIKSRANKQPISKPMIFNLSKIIHKNIFYKLLEKNPKICIVDNFLEQLKELFAVHNPQIFFGGNFEKQFTKFVNSVSDKENLNHLGRWVYFPWLQTVVHILEEKSFFELRTARNKLLITQEEQTKFYNAKIGIAGLSIGSSVALALVLQGGAKKIKLADFDTLSLSNTNRIRAGVQNLGLPKVDVTARQIYEINPYADIKIFYAGLTEKNVNTFTNDLDVIIDEMDDLSKKTLLRIQAKRKKIPLVMGADNADMAVIDIERYDKNSKIHFFHNRIEGASVKKLMNLNKFQSGQAIAKLIGLENHTPEMLDSLKQMGKSLISWPQLGGTAMINGSAVAYCVRKIITDGSLIDNRAIISLESIFKKNYFSKKEKILRSRAIKKFKNILKLD